MRDMRILVADGSAMYRKMFEQAAAELDRNAVVVCAESAAVATGSISGSDYEIVVIDAEIPGVDKLLKETVSALPKSFILITARPSRATDEICGEALTKGAADCLTKPIHSSYDENYDVIRDKLRDIIEALSEGRSKKREWPNREQCNPKANGNECSFCPEIVLIASSTGGPPALECVLSRLSKGFPAPILIVQHMLMHFTGVLGRNLDMKSPLWVKTAENGEFVEPGTVYLAPGGSHMKLAPDTRIRLDDSPLINGVKPAADALFCSVAESYAGRGVLAVILTGMGRDGEKGLAMLKKKTNCYCLAQSEETCVVYGMPRVAVESGYADKVLDLNDIPLEMELLFKRQG